MAWLAMAPSQKVGHDELDSLQLQGQESQICCLPLADRRSTLQSGTGPLPFPADVQTNTQTRKTRDSFGKQRPTITC